MGQTKEQRRLKEMKRRDDANKTISEHLLSIGAVETPGAWHQFNLRTKAGDLGISPIDGKWIACRFGDVKLALQFVPKELQDHLNPYSGKWNFFNFGEVAMDGLKALEVFKREVSAIL